MLHEENTWIHYVKNIIAADVSSAIFLASFLRRNNLKRNYASALEVVDLNSYKIYKKKNIVWAKLTNDRNTPFVFFVGKN